MLTVEDLKVRFSRYEGLFGRRVTTVLDGVDLEVDAGEFVAVVGQSGAGKSLLAHAILGILPFNATVEGRFVFDGEDLCQRRRRALRGKRIALVPQAVTWLDPTATAGRQVGWSARAAGRRVDERLIASEFARYDLAATARRLFPHELSGGMARRVLTATATVSRADLLIADEPTTGLDPQVRDLALGLLRDLADKGKAVVVITHDLAAAMAVADRIVVLRSGRTVEAASAAVFRSGTPSHPYSRALRAALPTHGFALPSTVTDGVGSSGACGHLGDCETASPPCATIPPPWVVQSSSRVRCHDARSA